MSEQTLQTQETAEQVQPSANALADAVWGVTPPATDTVETTPVVEAKIDAPLVEKKPEEEVIDANEYLKTNLGFDNWDVAKTEIENLRKSATTKEEVKFANEKSEKLFKAFLEGKEDEIYNSLHEKRKLDKLTTTDVDKNTAAEIIKLSLQAKNKDLTADDVDFLFERKFATPAKPSQGLDETDEDYAITVSNWEKLVHEKEKELIIEAKLARPELEKLKSEIVFPDITQKEVPQTTTQPTQEDLEAANKFKESFLQTAKSAIDNFEGFKAVVKDKDVEIPLNYIPSQEEKTLLQNKVNDFAESGFNANVIMAERWVNEDGTVNTNQMVKDLSKIYFEEKSSGKLVNDAAAKRLELYLKDKKQIDVNGNNQRGQFNPDQKTQTEALQDFFFSN